VKAAMPRFHLRRFTLSVERILVSVAAVATLGGCHISARLNPDCHVRQEYQSARQVSSLSVPEGLDSPNTQSSLVIPTVDLAPPPPGPHDTCLDVPPRYKPAAPNKAATPAPPG
jgi:uncharacterized lipoprotein